MSLTARTGEGTPGPPEGTAQKSAAPSGPTKLTMAAAITGGFIALLDTTIVNVSLKDTTARFGAINQVQWVVTVYLIALAAAMPATGWLATRFGVRRVFACATTLFLLGSAACTFSQSLTELVAARGVSGLAAGVLTPVSTILLTTGVPREHLGRVQALNGSVMLISPLLGPTIGGLLVEAGGWSAVYAVNVPLCAALLFVTLRWVRRDTPAGNQVKPLDVVGLVSSAACTVCTVLAIHEFSAHAFKGRADFLVPLALAVASGAVFVVRELRARFPLLDVRLFAIRVYRTSAINIFCLGFVLYSPMMLIPLYFESARGESAVTTGLLMSTGGVGVVCAAWLCRVLMKRIGGGGTVVLGISLTIVATVPLTTLSADTSYVLLCASLVVRGLGTGLTIVPAMTRAFESIKPQSIADASSQLNLIQRIGGAVAIAVVTVVLEQAAHRRHGLVPGAFAHSFGWLLWVYAVTLIPAAALLLADRREARQNAE
ncbi:MULTISPECIES: DHA2 family efflux MFS transporter permease subunit [unclassified Streptomyces]|uniref:DHA2 family efflux MFS transporter permease subunit n=1 Tax=unclassified Streptomyces TaxID=2593676 RepID=UPI001F039964|nr:MULTISPECIES: DHA2 family efflux MFS transporter permease subunit [unclassified Streptomyces]MCH0566834.1 DHA2 family efflux MFS transporter permease subunit [Streptomyces sp. MUM 2J]MCH0570234.1 DHA2 family efflux MFS transporter permease subunit [Streptomyces sp. MUM 136J]